MSNERQKPGSVYSENVVEAKETPEAGLPSKTSDADNKRKDSTHEVANSD